MTMQVEKLARKARAYSKIEDNPQLLKQVDYSLSDIQDGSDEETLVRCENIASAVEGIKDTLTTDYALDETLLTSVNTDIATIREVINSRTDESSQGVAATSSIKENMGQMREKFDLLDDLIYGIIEDEDFLKVYRNTRQIIDR